MRHHSSFYSDGYQDAQTGFTSSPPDVSVYAQEYAAGFAEFESETKLEQAINGGWVCGNDDGYVGKRIYPSWRGALEGKRLVCRDVRIFGGKFLIHNPWTNVTDLCFDTLPEVEAHILENGKVMEEGANVWD